MRRSRQSSHNEEGLEILPSRRMQSNRLSTIMRIFTASLVAVLLVGFLIVKFNNFSFQNDQNDLQKLLKRKDALIQRLVLNVFYDI